MFEHKTALLKGDDLLLSYMGTVYPHSFDMGVGPLVAVENDGTVKVFCKGLEAPRIVVVSAAEQLVYAMGQILSNEPEFMIEDTSRLTACKIGDAVGFGNDYFEAGMKAHLLHLLNEKPSVVIED